MRLLLSPVVALATLQLGTVQAIGEIFGADQMAAVRPVPEAYDTANPTRVNITVNRDTECKNCPYGSCLNAGIMWTGTVAPFQCWTQGELVGSTKTWLRYQFGTRQDEFCYVTTYDLQQYSGSFTVDLPYCGTKSELLFYLPTQRVKTIYYTECSLCPWRDCEGVKFYQSGTLLDVNCQVTDGWNQLGPQHPAGTRKYYRTPDNCYVSVNTVEELPGRPSLSTTIASKPTTLMQEPLPPCGPVPHLKAPNRPGLLESDGQKPQSSSTSRSTSATSRTTATSQQTSTTPATAKTPASTPRSTPAKSAPPKSAPPPPPPPEEEDNSDDDQERQLERTVTITRTPAASCRSCASLSCRSVRRFIRRRTAKVQCHDNSYLRTTSACYLQGTDTDLPVEEITKMPKCAGAVT